MKGRQKREVAVLLLEEVNGLGPAGSIVTVAEGFARNFLFPTGRAALADVPTKQSAAARHDQQRQEADKRRRELQTKAEQLEGTVLTIPARVKDGQDIYGRITSAQVARALVQQTGHPFKAKDIALPAAVTAVGEYNLAVTLGHDIEAILKLVIEPQPDDNHRGEPR